MTRYRRLPGYRRGLFRSSSVWLGDDHLLAVQSVRFREDYKRFHLRDVQAIVVADAPRFHISTRSLAIAVLWFAAWLVLRNFGGWTSAVLWTVAIGLAGAWLYVSAACSCTCRIYTAVSGEEVRSVYRTWTARRFLSQVEPRIAQAQGVLEGDWPEAVEARTIGPPGTRPAVTADTSPSDASIPTRLPVRTLASDVFLGSLFAGAAVDAAMRLSAGAYLEWIGYILTIAEVAAACVIFAQAYRRRIKPAMQKLALAALVVLGLLYYARPFLQGVAEGAIPQAGRRTTISASLPAPPSSRLFQRVELAANLLLGVAGLAIIGMDRDEAGVS